MLSSAWAWCIWIVMFRRSINPQLHSDQVPLYKQFSPRLFWMLNLVQKYAPMVPFHANGHLKIVLAQYVSRIFSLTGLLSVLKNVDASADACAIVCWSKCIDIPFTDHPCGWCLRYVLLTAKLFLTYYYQGCVIVWSDLMVLNSHDLLCTHNLES